MGLLRIVHLEINDADAKLVSAELKNSAIECELIRARSLSELTTELAQRPVDIVLADRPGPAADGLRALAVARENVPGVPFIFVCGTDEPDQVGESLRAGATDFILKDQLPRLVPSIRRVIQEARTQRDLQNVRRELLRHAELLDLANDAIVISDSEGKISYWNRGAERMYGWSREEATGRDVHELLQTGPPEQLASVLRDIAGGTPLGRRDPPDSPGRLGDRRLDWLDPAGQRSRGLFASTQYRCDQSDRCGGSIAPE